jgi:hypothetical protein
VSVVLAAGEEQEEDMSNGGGEVERVSWDSVKAGESSEECEL